MPGLLELYIGSATRYVKQHKVKKTVNKISRAEVDLNVLKSLDASDLDPLYKFSWYSAILHGDIFESYWAGIKITYKLSQTAVRTYEPDSSLLSFHTPPTSPEDGEGLDQAHLAAEDTSDASDTIGVGTIYGSPPDTIGTEEENLKPVVHTANFEHAGTETAFTPLQPYSRSSSTPFSSNAIEYNSLTGTLVPKKNLQESPSQRKVHFADSEIAALNAATRAEEDEDWKEQELKKSARGPGGTKRKAKGDPAYNSRSKRGRGGARGARVGKATTPRRRGPKAVKKDIADAAEVGAIEDPTISSGSFVISTPASFGHLQNDTASEMPLTPQRRGLDPLSGTVQISTRTADPVEISKWDNTTVKDFDTGSEQQDDGSVHEARPLLGFAALTAKAAAKTKVVADELNF